MSEYKQVNGKKFRLCKYQCGKNLTWNPEANAFVEEDDTLHTIQRCRKLKEIQQDPDKKQAVDTLKDIVNVTNQKEQQQFNHHDVITLEQVLRKLRMIGIDIDLDKLLRESEYIR